MINRSDERKHLTCLKAKYEEYLLNINERLKEIDKDETKN